MVEQLEKDMISALKAGEKERLQIIREIKAGLKQANIDFKKEINDELLIEVVSKCVKMRNESIKEFEKGNREDLASKTKQEIEYLSVYLPTQLTEEEIITIIDKVFIDVRPEGPRDMGKIMGLVTQLVKGKADMTLVSSIIKDKLNS